MSFDRSLMNNIEFYLSEHNTINAKQYLELKTKLRCIGVDPFDLYRKTVRKLLK